MNRQSRFCDQCGTGLVGEDWPKKCVGCGRGVWPNPTPIGVALIPIVGFAGDVGLLVGRRGHQPKMNEFGLPGGFHDDHPDGETTLQCAVREVREETGLVLSHTDFEHFHEYSNPAQSQVLHFYQYVGVPLLENLNVKLGECKVSPECTELALWYGDYANDPLCFDSHQQAAMMWERLGRDMRLYGTRSLY